MAAPDPLALLEPEDSLESWDSPDPRVLLYVVCPRRYHLSIWLKIQTEE